MAEEDQTNIMPQLTHAYMSCGKKIGAFLLVTIADDGIHVFTGNPRSFALIGAAACASTALLQGGIDPMFRSAPDQGEKAEVQAAEPDSIWVLTREINQYDQDGEYFVAAFNRKPAVDDLLSALGWSNLQESLDCANHILAGGGRQGTEEEWFHLRQHIIPFVKG
jgi:hypothetical protein